MDHRLLSAPTDEPIALDIARQHLRVVDEFDDALITVYLQAARETVERYTGRALVTQRWELRLPCVSPSGVTLPACPVQSVESVTVITADGDTITVSPNDYTVLIPSGPNAERAVLLPACGVPWPTPANRRDAVRITYVAGYGGSAGLLPAMLTAAVLLGLGSLYESREAEAEKSGSTTRMLAENPAFTRLLTPYRLWW